MDEGVSKSALRVVFLVSPIGKPSYFGPTNYWRQIAGQHAGVFTTNFCSQCQVLQDCQGVGRRRNEDGKSMR